MIRSISILIGTLAIILGFVATPAPAEEHSFQLSLITPVQIYSEDESIKGLRLNLLYGRNASVKGLDWGFINHTTSGVSKGWQTGFLGIVDADFVGWQDNSVNIVKGSFEGFQLGAFNYAKNASGFQLGLINYAETMHGLQIGFLNIIRQDGALPFLPIVNWSF